MIAPELKFEKRDWINSPPLDLNQQRGKIILLDFFTYSCINCVRTFPALKRIWDRYANLGVFVIGIHSPEFDFERIPKNVERALQRHDLKYPVLLDSNHHNFKSFEAPGWPHAILISPQGTIILTHTGEQGYNHIEEAIRDELKKQGQNPTQKIDPEQRHFTSPETSPELYTGFDKGANFGSSRICTKEGCDEFKESTTHHKNTLYPHGDWQEKSESITLIGDTGSLSICAYAKEMYVVLNAEKPCEITRDNKPLDPLELGVDIIQKDQKTILIPHGPDVYNILRSDTSTLQTIKITGTKGLTVYSFVCN